MRRPLTLGLLALLALASPAEAHSWTACSVIGILEPGSVRCAGADCVVTVRPEPLVPTASIAVREPLAVSFSSKATWTDRDREVPWPDLPSALAGLQGALVRVAGDLDNLEGHHVLFHTHRIVHLRAAPPSGGHPPVFGACGPPPWSEATIARCSTWTTRLHKVTVEGTLESDADAPEGGRSGAWLELDALTVSDASGVLEPPVAHEVAYVAPTALFASAGPARPTLAALRAGDRVKLEATYEMPTPSKDSGAPGDVCSGTNCVPWLRVREVRRIVGP